MTERSAPRIGTSARAATLTRAGRLREPFAEERADALNLPSVPTIVSAAKRKFASDEYEEEYEFALSIAL